MPIDDIVADQARRGEIEPEFATQVAGQRAGETAMLARNPRRARREARRRREQGLPTVDNITQMEKTDLQFWVEVGILVMLVMIWTRL